MRPHRVRGGDLYVGAGGVGPAELGVERIGAAGWRQQHDRRRLRIDRLAELDQRQIVDASAFERDRALQAVGCDRDARRGRQRPRRGWRRRQRGLAPLGRAPAPVRAARGLAAGWPGWLGCAASVSAAFAQAVRACSFSCLAFSCGMAKKNCQAISTRADSTMARMVFLLSVIGMPFCRCAPHALAATPPRSPRRSARTEP